MNLRDEINYCLKKYNKTNITDESIKDIYDILFNKLKTNGRDIQFNINIINYTNFEKHIEVIIDDTNEVN